MIEVDTQQANRIRELVAGGMDPDEAVAKVMATPLPRASATATVGEKPKKKHKYSAIPTDVDGIRFASRAEARRYQALRLMEEAGAIRDLVLQPRYPIKVNGALICTYVADFRYFDNERGCEVVEDVKSGPTKTPVYRVKNKLMKVVHGIDITEVSV